MLKNYFKLAWRNLAKEKVYAAINILGLAAGIASCLIILLYISKELSFDTFHKNANRIYRISLSFKTGDQNSIMAWAPVPLGQTIKSVIPEVSGVVQLFSKEAETIVERNDMKVYEPGFVYATPSLFEVFDFPITSGEARASLKEPYNILLSESMAAKYFTGKDPIGEMLQIDNKHPYKVTGVFKNIPDNSHIRFDFVASLESLYLSDLKRENWYAGGMHTYVLLEERADRNAFERKLDEFRDTQMAVPFNFEKGKEPPVALIATRLADIHLRTGFIAEIAHQGDINYVYIFSAIALLILLIACINYTNLATAVAVKRGREVGIRKVHGARRPQLIRQYLSESFLFVGIALILAFTLAEFFLPRINEIMSRSITINWTDPKMLLIFAGLWLLVGIGAGIYPALYLSGFNAGHILKSQEHVLSKNILRKVLITFQLSVSIVLITCMLIIQSQVALVRESTPGYHQEQVIMIPTRNEFAEKYTKLRDRLHAHSSISSVTTTSFKAGEAGQINFYKAKDIEGLAGEDALVVDVINVGFDFEKTFGLSIVSGRAFSEAYKTDLAEAIIINEAAVKKFGWTDPIDKTIGSSGETPRHVIGVIKDFHYKSLKEQMVPVVLFPTDKAARLIAIRLNAGDISSAIAQAQSEWHEIIPELPFSYSFLDDSFDALYRTELRLNTLISGFSMLAVLIACMGLLGLSTFMAEQKAKEIGIRKTLGASVGNIVSLLTGDFIKWVGLAIVIAIPCAYYVMSKWLQSFQYKVEIRVVFFAGAGAIVFLLVLLTTGWKSVQAALQNPVDILKDN